MTILSAGTLMAVGKAVLGVVWDLVAHPDVNGAGIAVDGYHARVRLQVGLVYMLRGKTIFENPIRLAKPLLEYRPAATLRGNRYFSAACRSWAVLDTPPGVRAVPARLR
jgi:hypothetical protein